VGMVMVSGGMGCRVGPGGPWDSGGLHGFPDFASQLLKRTWPDNGLKCFFHGGAFGDAGEDQGGDGLSLGHGWWWVVGGSLPPVNLS